MNPSDNIEAISFIDPDGKLSITIVLPEKHDSAKIVIGDIHEEVSGSRIVTLSFPNSLGLESSVVVTSGSLKKEFKIPSDDGTVGAKEKDKKKKEKKMVSTFTIEYCHANIAPEAKLIDHYFNSVFGLPILNVIYHLGGRNHLATFEPYITLREKSTCGLALNNLALSKFLPEGITGKAKALLQELIGYGVNDDRIPVLMYYLLRTTSPYGNINALMDAENIEDVICNGASANLWVVHRKHQVLETNFTLSIQDLEKIVTNVFNSAGRSISPARPASDVKVPAGRFAAVYGSEVSPATAFSFRLVGRTPLPMSKLIEFGLMSPLMAAYLWLLVEYRKPLFSCGDIGIGKTTFINALLGLVRPERRVITIEETQELIVPSGNWLPFYTRESSSIDGRGQVTLDELLKVALRHRADYLIVGEVRGSEVGTFFRAITVGQGGLATIHAENIVDRLKSLLDESTFNLISTLACSVYLTKIGGRRYINKITEIVEGSSDDAPWDDSDDNQAVREATIFTLEMGDAGPIYSPDSIEQVVKTSSVLEKVSSAGRVDMAHELLLRRDFLQKNIGAPYRVFHQRLSDFYDANPLT